MHKKGITEEGTMRECVYVHERAALERSHPHTRTVAKKRTRKTVKYQRAVVGASFEAIKAKRQQKPEERQQARDAAVKKAKEAKKADAEKKAAAKVCSHVVCCVSDYLC